MKIVVSVALCTVLSLLLLACPGPLTEPPIDAGVSVSVSIAAGVGAGSPEEVKPECVNSQPTARTEGWVCAYDTDCYDVSNCTTDVCNLKTGKCENAAVPSSGCDQIPGWYGVCVEKSCCPEKPVPVTPAAAPTPQ